MKLLLLLVLVAMNFRANQASAANRFHNETDRLALLEFKHQISNDPYGVLNSWNHSQHHCQWQGVTCDKRHQRVEALSLAGKSLSGTISPQIGTMSFLKFINLGENQFHGEIPKEVGRLFRLRYLNLTNNRLRGKIPDDLTNCSQTVILSLSKNKLEGRIPSQLGNLQKLEHFYLRINNLTGKIPSSIGNLSSLTELSLAFNNLDGNLPHEMGLLTGLSKLGLGVNNLSGVIPASVYNISALNILSIAENFFRGNLPTKIGLTLTNLQFLGVGGNKFYGNIPMSITNASKLVLLDLGTNKFEGKVPTNLGVMQNLQKFFIEDNLLGSNSTRDLEFIASLTNCSSLEEISLEGNNFGGQIPKVMTNLSNQLTKLIMRHNQFLGTIPEGFGNFVKMYMFDMSWNSLSGGIPSDFGKFQNLQYLSLERNRMSGEILSSLCNITTLYHLELRGNRFEGSNIFVNILDYCQNLQYLDISQNNLSGVISPHFFDKHSSLAYLNLAQNTFSGSIPHGVGKLTHLVSFNVSYNKFFGEIPLSLVDCSSLENLCMQTNFFQGIIPPNLASLKSIMQLDLSNNNLTGQIPGDLVKLKLLRYLNLSFNDLEGVIPTTGIFGNASQITLIGNKKLCGGIPEMDFPSCPIIKGKNKGKLKVIIALSTVLPVMVLVLGALIFYLVIYRKRYRRKADVSTMPIRVDQLLRVSYHELHRAALGFSPENIIGSGSFGVVYKGRLDQHGNKVVAVKVLDLQKNGASKSFKAKCKALRNIRHRNLVSIISYCSSIDSKGEEFKALIYEFLENGNLDSWLHPDTTVQTTSSRNLNHFQRLNIAIDVASALHYLHDHSGTTVVHCDLKPSNILLDNDFVAHMGDFGLARLLPKTINASSDQGTSSTIPIRGSIGYAAPEYGMGHEASTQGDVYAYGILLLEMFTGKRPTDDMFRDGLNLHNYVKRALPEQLCTIVDPLLLSNGDDRDDDDEETTAQVELHNDEKRMVCLISILKIGVNCSAPLPNDGMPMSETVRELHLLKEGWLGARVNRANF